MKSKIRPYRDYLRKFEASAVLFELEKAATGGKFRRNVDRAKDVIGRHKGLMLAGGGRAIETAIKELKEEGMAIKYRRKINDYWEVEVVKGAELGEGFQSTPPLQTGHEAPARQRCC